MMRRSFNLLRKSEEGTATVELAVVASMFATMLIGVVDVTTAFNRKMEMEQALQRALEKIMNTTTFTTPTQTIREEVVAAVDGIAAEDISVDYLLECENVIQEQSGTAETPAPTETGETSTDTTQTADTSATTETTDGGEGTESTIPEEEEPDAAAGCHPSEVQRRYITASVTDEFEPFFPIHKLGFAGTTFTITAKAGMRVE